MKYIKKFEKASDDIFNYLDSWGLKYGVDYTHKDNKLAFVEDVDISNHKMPNGIFPYKLESAQGLTMRNCGLISFENFPEVAYNNIDVKNNYIKNMKYFPQRIRHFTHLDISHNEIEDLIGIPIDMMYYDHVKYGDLDREILDAYWHHQLEEVEATELIKYLTVSRNTRKNNTVSPGSDLGHMIKGLSRSRDLFQYNKI